MSILSGPRSGDVLCLKGRFTVANGDLQVGLSAGRGQTAVVLYLGHCSDNQADTFDAEAALRRLGWVPAKEKP